MSQTEDQIGTDAPPYAVPPAPPAPTPEQPAQMNAMQRLWGTLLSPGTTFNDVNRKPTILVPILLAVILSAASGVFFSWKVKPDWDRIFRAQIQKQVERSGQSLPPEQIEQRVALSKKITSAFPIIAAVFTPVYYLIIAGIFALGLMLIQAKTTFKKILSVVSWSYTATALVQLIVFIGAVMIQDQETLNSIDPTKGVHIVPSNVGAFLSAETSPGLLALASWLDIFSIWYLIILSIGLAAIAGSKRITPKKTGVLVFGGWALVVLLSVAWRSIQG